MAGEAKQLRDFIEVCLDRSDTASLVDVIAYFDHQNHSLPSTWRLNMALAELATPVAFSPDRLHLERAGQKKALQLSDSDMSRIMEAYSKALHAKSDGA